MAEEETEEERHTVIQPGPDPAAQHTRGLTVHLNTFIHIKGGGKARQSGGLDLGLKTERQKGREEGRFGFKLWKCPLHLGCR